MAIAIPYKGKTYTLEFTRRTVRTMENQGFNLNDIGDKPMTTIPALFRGAFYAHHKGLKPEFVDEMFDNITKKDELITKLAEMYAEPFTSLLGEPEADNEENVSWSVV